MQLMLKPGRYVAAVSGGVDSMVLLELLKRRPGVKVTVAHLDHGIRPDSHEDRRLVQETAKEHGLPFVYHRIELGADADEATARQVRYDFLKKVKHASQARAIITAHHRDDRLETAVHNMLRGTGRRGYTSLQSTDGIIRPLLPYTKNRLYDYAKLKNLRWREDQTNQDTAYRRNFIRHNVLSKLTEGQREQLHILLDQLEELNKQIDGLLANMLHVQPGLETVDRQWFISLPHRIATELMHAWLLRHGVTDITQKNIEALVHAAKTSRNGKQFDIPGGLNLLVDNDTLAIRDITG